MKSDSTPEHSVQHLASKSSADLCEVLMDELVELSERHRIIELAFVFLEMTNACHHLPISRDRRVPLNVVLTFDSCIRKSLNSEAVTGCWSLTCL